MTKIALIDGDELTYKAGFASQHVHYECYESEDSEECLSKFAYKKQAVEWASDKEGIIIRKTLEVKDVDEAYMNLQSAFRTIMSDKIGRASCRERV